jgi:glucokinase
MEGYVVGIDVGGTKIACGLFDKNRRLIAERRSPSNPDLNPGEFFTSLARDIQELLDGESVKREQLRGIGLGMPSFIIYEKGHIVKTSNLVKIRDFPARAYLSGYFEEVPIVLDNDAHAAALAESRLGAGRGFRHMLYCPVSTGISSGIVIDGKLFRGTYGWSGESGHMIITPGEGLLCGCGNRGCFMSWCSGSMIVKHISQWINEGEKTLMTELAGDDPINCRHLAEAYDRGDPLAVRGLNQMVRYLGLWFFNLYTSLNINCFVLGGGLLNLGEKLLSPVRKIFDDYNHNDMSVYFKTAELGDRAGLIGAAELIFGEENIR